MASMNEIDDFLNGALVSWLESCLSRPELISGYSSLLDGSILHSVWLQIDPEPQHHPIPLTNLEGSLLFNVRTKNFDSIVKNLKSFYEEELGQIILTLPDCYILGHNPETHVGLENLKTLLTLLLGAAVQCPNKEIFISKIKELDVNTQHAIVELIKQVTDNHSLVITQESIDNLTPNIMYDHIVRLTKQRDNYYSKWMSSINVESMDGVPQHGGESENTQNTPMTVTSNGTRNASTPSSTESNHTLVELADLKSKLRKLRQELEEKTEAYLEIKEELDHKANQYDKLRAESQEWYAEAKRAAAYRDEVDVLRERAERADRLEIEAQKFREKLSDSEFYKTRVEELREDNRVLMETKEMLEEQLMRSRKRGEHVMTLESEIIKYKQKLNDMALERDVDKRKLQELIEENTQLQLVAKNLNINQDIDKSLSENEEDCNSGDNSLSEQLTNSAQTRALKLELENKRLLAALDQLKESSFHELTNKILELEKEKKMLSLKLEQIQETCNRLSQQNKELENVFRDALEENKKLQDSLDSRQKTLEKQNQEREIDRNKIADLEQYMESCNKDKQRLQTLNESIQRRADDLERLLETKIKEVETFKIKAEELESIKNKNYELEMKISTLEKENTNLTRDVLKLKENLEVKSVQLDETLSTTETQIKEIQRLSKNLEETNYELNKIQELEITNQELIKQREIDLQTIETLQKELVNGTLATNKFKHNLEKLGINNQEIDTNDLNVEIVVDKLVRNPETFKTVREIMLNFGREQQQYEGNQYGLAKSDICVLCHRKEIFTVEKNIEISDTSSNSLEIGKLGRVCDIKISATSANDEKWKEQYEQLIATNAALQKENETLQAENAKFNVDISTLRSQITSLNAQHFALQLTNSQLATEKDVLLKQNETLKQDHKNLVHDQITLQCLHDQLNSEYESLNKDKESLKAIIKDSRNEIKDLKEKCDNLEKISNEQKLQITTMKSSADDLATLRAEHSKLTEDFRHLFATNDRFKNEYKNIQEQYKMIKAENNRLKLQNTELTGDLNLRMDQVKTLEIEYTKVAQRCEMLVQMNANLDTDRRALMDNVSQLLTQYHELLTHSLEDKKHYHEEEKLYTDKVNNLNRQKEKLEEKIMEHYKKAENCTPKKKAFASNFVKRVKKASSDLMSIVPSRHRRSWIEDSRLTQSEFHLGSESGGNESDNSTEEPNSISYSIPFRQVLQRKSSDSADNNSFVRGGVRSSLQSQKRNELNNSRRNSVHGRLEAPDVTGSSLTLGTAGSRKTVYLIDDNQKLPESHTSNTPEPTTPTNNTPPPTNNDNHTTFLMYNRINTMIGGNGGGGENLEQMKDDGTSSTNNVGAACGGNESSESGTLVNNDRSSMNSKKRNVDKTNSIWYEYGCV